MDTDFRMFSAQHHGNLPGIDLAYILDGAAYHTEQDTVTRIRKGTVQVWCPSRAESSFSSFTAATIAEEGSFLEEFCTVIQSRSSCRDCKRCAADRESRCLKQEKIFQVHGHSRRWMLSMAAHCLCMISSRLWGFVQAQKDTYGLQASGENILAAVYAFTEILSDPPTDLLEENAVFFDILGRLMVSMANTLPHKLWICVCLISPSTKAA